MKSTPSRVVAVAALVLATASTGIAVAAVQSTDVIHACASTKDGLMRLLEAGEECDKKEVALSWNQQGVPGADGSDGVDGTDGTDGAAGAPGLANFGRYTYLDPIPDDAAGLAGKSPVQVLCPPGQRALGGGYGLVSASTGRESTGSPYFTFSQNHPVAYASSEGTIEGWSVAWNVSLNFLGFSHVKVYVTCADVE